VFSTTNVAADQNQLTMEIMKKVADRHGLVCLLHEKPFQGVNGSGKHNNWSIATNTGENLFEPTSKPYDNTQFLLFLVAVIVAVDEYQDLLRMAVASSANDHRLGAHEAPPAIVSMYLGEELTSILECIESGRKYSPIKKSTMATGVHVLPDFQKDTTDRNRTSPFAFTGNKFEFRMVGSSDSVADSTITLNAIVAEALCEAADRLEKAEDFQLAVHDLIKEYMTKHQRIVFNGNGYSDEWVVEAEKRGLPNIKSTVEAAAALTSEKAAALFEKFAIYSKPELLSREEIIYETYAKTINIEALTMIEMAGKQIIPAVIKYTKTLAETVNAVKAAGVDASVQTELLKSVSKKLIAMQKALVKLQKAEAKGRTIQGAKEQAFFYKDVVTAAMNELRTPADELEMIVDKDIWPIPTYGELMFEV
jgi:glutamine synthetase